MRELWLIDEQNQTVEVRKQTGNGFGPGMVYHKGQHIVSAIFPDLTLPVERIFAQ
ncbi:MAG: hypothetical protein V7641_1821 [Blastocatellia bacterium]